MLRDSSPQERGKAPAQEMTIVWGRREQIIDYNTTEDQKDRAAQAPCIHLCVSTSKQRQGLYIFHTPAMPHKAEANNESLLVGEWFHYNKHEQLQAQADR